MHHFKYVLDEKTGQQYLETSLTGKLLLNTTILNKGTAFSEEERKLFGLRGKLPVCVESLSQQVQRAYKQFKRYQTDLSRNIYLNNLRDRNETLFYCLLSQHISEMMPIIYTPIVGTAVKEYSNEFRQPRGVYLTYGDKDLNGLLRNRTHPNIDLIVVTDGRGVLGIGDQGVGAMDIPIAKLMVYTLFGGIHPSRTLPVMLDVGTDNQALLNDPMYLGWRHPRVKGRDYDKFVERFVKAVQEEFPNAFLHWEDLGQIEAWNILNKYQHRLCTFNDDIQGTGCVTIGALYAAMKGLKQSWRDQRIVIFGAGTAGMGIADQIYAAMMRDGLTPEEARNRMWLIDRPGLLTTSVANVTPAQVTFLRKAEECNDWSRDEQGTINLMEVAARVKPTILIGCSAVAGAFNESVIKEILQHVPRPIIFPLSNPTERAEAHPADLLNWSHGEAIIATGSPFMGIAFKNENKDIPQSNNALAFPGIGLGILAAKATRCTESMIFAASDAISQLAPILQDPYANCLPSLKDARDISFHIAVSVVHQAIKEGVARIDDTLSVEDRVNNTRWTPSYLPLKKM